MQSGPSFIPQSFPTPTPTIMPGRQVHIHSRSRNGCRQCKTSHVKCDEARSTCKRCTRWGYKCDYSSFRYLRSENQPENQTPAMSSGNYELRLVKHMEFHTRPNRSSELLSREAAFYHAHLSSVLSPQGEQLRGATKKLELRLIHAFMSLLSSVQKTSVSGQGPQNNTLVLAMTYAYARDILIGCSAIYLRAYNANDKALIEASHEYAVRAIAEFSRELQNGIHQHNAEGLFFASMFIAKHAFASRQYEVSVKDDKVQKQDDLPLLRWLRQYRGIQAIMDAGWAWIPKSERLSPMLHALPTPLMMAKMQMETVFRIILDGLDESGNSPVVVAAYNVSVAYLSSIINDPDLRGLAGFPIAVSDELIKLLEERDPRAMTIMGSYLVLLTSSPKSGFLMAAARREYSEILEQLPAEWYAKMERIRVVIEQAF